MLIGANQAGSDPKNPASLTDDYILQVLAEAREAYQAGEKCYIEPADGPIFEYSARAQEAAKVEDPVEEAILFFLDSKVTEDFHKLEDWQKHYVVQGIKPSEVTERQWSQRKPLGETTNAEIYAVALEPKRLAKPGRATYSKIKNVVTGSPNWTYSGNISSEGLSAPGKRVRGYKRSK